jgi:hypothetical protein
MDQAPRLATAARHGACVALRRVGAGRASPAGSRQAFARVAALAEREAAACRGDAKAAARAEALHVTALTASARKRAKAGGRKARRGDGGEGAP